MQEGHYPLGESTIHYTVRGKGSVLLICFHGYGESEASFAFLTESLGKDFTLLAIDLPFHGSTRWKEDLFLAPADLLRLLTDIAVSLPGISGPWYLLGYSMGGRVALQLLEMIPDRVARLVLLVPDGLRMNPWYWLATQTGIGNRFFRRAMRRPGWLFTLLRFFHFIRLANPGIYKFVSYFIADNTAREQLYWRWTTLRGFRPDRRKIRSLIPAKKIQVRLLYGRFDRIIRWETGERFQKQIAGDWCRLTVIDSGHQLLQPKNLDVILTLLR